MINSHFGIRASPYEHCEAFAISSMLLNLRDDASLAEYLTSPLSGMVSRDQCVCLARLVAKLNYETGVKWFEQILVQNVGELLAAAGRVFVRECRITVFEEVCLNGRGLLRTIRSN
jgi:hypothetical protein